MKKIFFLLSFSLALVGSKAGAQTQIVLDDFTAGTQPGEGAAIDGSSWVGQVTQNATTITVAGTAHDDNGWGVFNLTPFDGSAMHSITITGQLDPGNQATSFDVQFFDDNFGSQSISIPTSDFETGMTTVTIPITSWIEIDIDATQLNGWTIGGGNFVSNGPDFRMTLDQLALSSSAIPEPGTAAALAGIAALGFALWRRHKART